MTDTPTTPAPAAPSPAAPTPSPAEALAAQMQTMKGRMQIEYDAVMSGQTLDQALELGRQYELQREPTPPADKSPSNRPQDSQAHFERDGIDAYADRYGLPDDVRAQLHGGNRVSAEEFRAAAQWRDRAFVDRDWVSRFRSGDMEARRQFGLMTTILAGNIEGK